MRQVVLSEEKGLATYCIARSSYSPLCRKAVVQTHNGNKTNLLLPFIFIDLQRIEKLLKRRSDNGHSNNGFQPRGPCWRTAEQNGNCMELPSILERTQGLAKSTRKVTRLRR